MYTALLPEYEKRRGGNVCVEFAACHTLDFLSLSLAEQTMHASSQDESVRIITLFSPSKSEITERKILSFPSHVISRHAKRVFPSELEMKGECQRIKTDAKTESVRSLARTLG